MKLTERQKTLLKALADTGHIATGKMLSNATNISLRTVQAEMSTLRKEGYIASGANGYRLISMDVIQTKKDIKNEALIKHLLSDEKHYDLYSLCDTFFVSESTMRQRLKEVDQFFSNENLHIQIHGSDVSIEGTELNKRLLIRKMILNDANFDGSLHSAFQDIDIEQFSNIIYHALETKGYFIQNPYANTLLVSVVICLYRIHKGIHTPDGPTYDESSEEYALAKFIANRFEEYFACTTTESDIYYIANLFQGQIVQQSHIHNELKIDEDFEGIIRAIFMEMFNNFSINIDFEPYLHTVAQHTFELIRRARANNYVISNNYISIRENCPYIYELAVYFAQSLDAMYHINIPDDEIGFLSLHLGLIIRQANQNDSTVMILLHITNFHGIADRITSILYANYEDKIAIVRWDPSSNSIPNHNFDLIITSEHLDIIGHDIIEITPFYDMIDRANVDAAISQCIKKSRHKKEYQALMDCFHPDLFFIKDDIHTSEEAISFLGQNMIHYGICEKGYVQSVIDRESLSPTSFFDTFAIPHSMEMNANKTTFAILINPNGIQWNHTLVKLVLMIAIKKEDLQDFSNIYDGVVHVLCDTKRYNDLIQSTNIQEFMKRIQID